MFNKYPPHIVENLALPILLLIFIKVVLKVNIIIFILLIIFIILFYNFELYFIPQKYYKDNIIKICSHDLAHLGDHIMNTFLFNKLKRYIENNGIIIEYYCNNKYHKEVIDFKNSKNIKIYDFKPIGYHLNGINFWNSEVYNGTKSYDELYKKIFNKCCKDIGIPYIMDNFYNEDDSLIIDYNNLKDIYKNIDILIINSLPLSNQYFLDITEWDNLVIYLNKKYNIVTTRKVKYIPCTLDDQLTIKKIAAISTKSKVIIGINTGPSTAIFNNFTLNYCKKIYMFDINNKYTTIPQLENVELINEIDLKKIDEIIKQN